MAFAKLETYLDKITKVSQCKIRWKGKFVQLSNGENIWLHEIDARKALVKELHYNEPHFDREHIKDFIANEVKHEVLEFVPV